MKRITILGFVVVGIFNLNIRCHAQTQPNIIVVMVDDLGYADVGFNGSPDIPTPNLDELAEGGTVLTSAYVTHPFCGPSRAGFITGRYPHNIGAQYNISHNYEGSDLGVPTNDRTLGTMMQLAGYRTGLMGKWHLGQEELFHPNNRGFDDFYGFLGGGHVYYPEDYVYNPNENTWDYKLPLEHNGQEVTESEYLTDGLTREGVRFIQESSQDTKPFFLFMSYNAPHTPLEAKTEDRNQTQIAQIGNADRRTFAAMVYAVDRGVGEMVAELKATNQFDNTLIIFFSDNGGRTDQGANNFPLSGAKGDTKEGGFRVPMFFHWPDQLSGNQTYDHPVSALDFYPTFAHLAGHKISAHKVFDGKNIWDDFKSGISARKGEAIYALRHRTGFSDVGVRRDNWKLYRWNNSSPWNLYNMDNDPGEKTDLKSQYPELVDTLHAMAKRWSNSHYDPFWFDSQGSQNTWNTNDMPGYDRTFGETIDLELGAAPERGPMPLFTSYTWPEEPEEPEEPEVLGIEPSLFQIYPNPVSQMINVNFQDAGHNALLSFRLVDMVGRIVMEEGDLRIDTDGNYKIPLLRSLRTGSYLLELTILSQTSVHRILVN